MLQFKALLFFLVLFGVPSSVTSLGVGSSVVYNLFGTDGHVQYSFGLVNAVLDESVNLTVNANPTGNEPVVLETNS